MQRNVQQAYPLISRLKNLDFWSWCSSFIDLYLDCPFGCIYCNTQKRSEFRGLHFTHTLPEKKETIGLGLISDVYSMDEGHNTTVSEILEFLFKEDYSVHIMTKSSAIAHQVEILKKFAEKDRVRVTFTLLTLNESIARELEGSSPSPQERLNALEILRKEGVPAGISISPIIPCINDGTESLSCLIGEGKRNKASWILFTGFDTVSAFRNSHLWRKTAELHSDPVNLESHYRHLRKFVVGRLLREELPLRIPRIPLDIYRRRYSTQIVSEHLFNISYLYELKENELKMLRYRRAAHEIESLQVSLKSIASSKKLGYIKGVNPEIEKVIEEILYTGGSTLHIKLYDSLKEECD